uniref:Uncharacterized protein n=1 Tax=viral metagenome TaxID=1070528 RepID=A0A6C0DA02_9ZZZZ
MNKNLISIILHPEIWINNEKYKTKVINKVIIESDYFYSKLDEDQQVKVNQIFGFVNFELTPSNASLLNEMMSLPLTFSKRLKHIDDKTTIIILRYLYMLMLSGYDLTSVVNNEKSETTGFKVVKETSTSNFGHNDLIIKGDVIFPPRKEPKPLICDKLRSGYINYYNDSYDNYDQSGGSYPSINNSEPIFDKLAEINSKNVDRVNDQKKFFELYRYGINKLNKPNDNDTPTFSISLFMPYSKIINPDYSDWILKYFQNHLKQIILTNYYFPDANYRTYLDWYMLNAFEKFSGNDDRLKVTKYISKFEHDDYENININNINNLLTKYYNNIKEYENYEFESGLCRILFYYDMACKTGSNKTGDFFVYKFKGPFIENVGNENECHISDGYIGQGVRYISTIQTKYTWNNIIINRPKHLIWRDAHTNSLGQNDYEWINTLYQISKNKNNKLFFVPSSIEYSPGWHDRVKCNVDKSNKLRSAIAGIIQFINFTDDNSIIPFNIYKQSIGMMFLLDNNNNLPLKIHRPYQCVGHMIKEISPGVKQKGIIVSDYEYGIEEYAFSSFFRIEYFRINSIYYNHHFIGRVFNKESYKNPNNTLSNVEFLLFKYLFISKKINNDTIISVFDFINMIEELRNDITLKNDKALRLLLSIYPTKYLFNETIFSISKNRKESLRKMKFIEAEKIANEYIKDIDINLASLNKINISCRLSALNNALEWCTYPYLGNVITDIECNPDDYLSGFYYDKQPSLISGFLRSPKDLEYVINVLENNKLKLKLNISNYKLNKENDNLQKVIQNGIDDNNNGHIKSALQNIILMYGEVDKQLGGITEGEKIANIVSFINPKGTNATQSNVWVPLIWKSLNYAGYDVPPEYFINLKLNNDEDHRIFNENVIKLSKLNGWAEYAIDILISNTEKYSKSDNSFESQKVIDESKKYKNKNHGDLSPYKMDTYNTPNINFIKLIQQNDRSFINNSITNLFSKYKINDKDIPTLQFIYDSTFSPIYQALSWKLLECIMEKTGTQDKFIFNDSGNVLAFYEYGVPQYPFDDDIDIGFITDKDYNDYRKFMKDCINNGFDIFVFEKITPDVKYISGNSRWYKPENALRIDLTSINQVDKYNPDNIWFIKVKMSYPKFIETSNKLGLSRFKLNEGESNVEAIPWVDVFPWFKEDSSSTEYKIQFADWHNFNPLSVALTTPPINAYGLQIKHPDNLLTLVKNKYNKGPEEKKNDRNWNQYKTGGRIYNHTFNKTGPYKLEYKDIINFVDDYVNQHNIEIKRIMDSLNCNDMAGEVFKQPKLDLKGGTYKEKYLKYKAKYMALRKNI